jgi:hypothetical protein
MTVTTSVRCGQADRTAWRAGQGDTQCIRRLARRSQAVLALSSTAAHLHVLFGHIRVDDKLWTRQDLQVALLLVYAAGPERCTHLAL